MNDRDLMSAIVHFALAVLWYAGAVIMAVYIYKPIMWVITAVFSGTCMLGLAVWDLVAWRRGAHTE